MLVILNPRELEAFKKMAPGHRFNHAKLRQLQGRLQKDALEVDPRDIHDARAAAKDWKESYAKQYAALLSAADRY